MTTIDFIIIFSILLIEYFWAEAYKKHWLSSRSWLSLFIKLLTLWILGLLSNRILLYLALGIFIFIKHLILAMLLIWNTVCKKPSKKKTT